MTDLIDHASARESEILSDQLENQRRRSGLTGKTVVDSAYFCSDCEEPIIDARRVAYPGVQRCIDCQKLRERDRHV